MKIEIKNKFNGEVIFSYESKENSFSLTVKLAIEKKINLSHADLSHADLSGTDLHGANLRGTNLLGADLSHADLSGTDLHGANLLGANLLGANLSHADLRGANLRGANLRGANLSHADLRGANFKYCIGNSKEICSMQITCWRIAFSKTHLAIGCQQHEIQKWRDFSDNEISKMDGKAIEWWEKWKDFIFQAIEMSRLN